MPTRWKGFREPDSRIFPQIVRPMFPLGTPLLPNGSMSLHIFEPRYRALARRCVDGDEPFGIVLIERGSEVGGGDVRADVGCLAEIDEYEELPDGRWTMSVRGADRIRILEWLTDDPYPRAITQTWPDAPGELSDEVRSALIERIRRANLLLTESGIVEPTDSFRTAIDNLVEWLEDELWHDEGWSFLAATSVPAGEYDRQRLLCAPDPQARVEVIGEVIDGVEEMLGER